MKNKNLLSSVALFSELYSNSDKDIFDIIGDFILGICTIESKYSFRSAELKLLMESTFGFDIPEAVLKTVLNNRLNKKLNRNGLVYNFEITQNHGRDAIKDKYNTINNEHKNLFLNLIKFIEERTQRKLTSQQQRKLEDNFYEYLLDNGYSEEYSNYISAFFVKNEGNGNFRDILLSIKEGLILYEGIKYSPDLNELGTWKNNLTIYLGTEYLFNSQGLNGELYKEMFNDFYTLVQEINIKNKGGKKTIELKYFTETKLEIDNFFSTAEKIKSGKLSLKISKPAMVDIVNNAKEVSDVALRKTLFYRGLLNLGIYEDDYECSIEELERYNLEDKTILEEIEKISKEKNRIFNEVDTVELIKIFTKINCLRKGNSKVNFEKCSYLYISENSLARYLGHNNLLKIKEGDFTYCKEMDFVTTKFWFYLNKGLNQHKDCLPKTFDLINKAKIIISSHLQNSVVEKFDEFSERVRNNELSEEEIKIYNLELKSKISNPEKIVVDTVDNSLDFLENEDYLNRAYEENILKDKKLKEQEKKLQYFYEKESLEKQKKAEEVFEHEKLKWSRQEAQNDKNINKKNLQYFLKCLIPEFFIIIITVVIFRINSITDWLKTISDNVTMIFWIFLILVLLSFQFIKSNFVDKTKVAEGWKVLKLYRYYFSEKFIRDRVDFHKSNYKPTDNLNQ